MMDCVPRILWSTHSTFFDFGTSWRVFSFLEPLAISLLSEESKEDKLMELVSHRSDIASSESRFFIQAKSYSIVSSNNWG